MFVMHVLNITVVANIVSGETLFTKRAMKPADTSAELKIHVFKGFYLTVHPHPAKIPE